MTQITIRQRGVQPGGQVLKRAIEPAIRRKAGKHIGYTSAQGATPEEVAWFAKHGAREVVSEALAQDGLSREVFFSRIYTLEKGDVVYLLDLAHIPDQFRANMEAQGVKIVVIGPAPAQAQATKAQGARFVSITPKPKLGLPASFNPAPKAKPPLSETIAANAARAKARASGGQRPQSLPNAESARAPKARDPLASMALAGSLGVTKALEPASVIKFPRAPASSQVGDLFAGGLGVQTRRAPPIIYAYGGYETSLATIEKFKQAGAHSFNREAKTGRGNLFGLMARAARGDVILVERLTDLCTASRLEKTMRELRERGVAVVTLVGQIDSRTENGRGQIAKAELASKALFGSLRL